MLQTNTLPVIIRKRNKTDRKKGPGQEKNLNCSIILKHKKPSNTENMEPKSLTEILFRGLSSSTVCLRLDRGWHETGLQSDSVLPPIVKVIV